MKQLIVRWGIACSVVVAMAGCGGGGGGNAQPPSSAAVNSALATASALAANDTAINSAAPFTAVQAAGVPVVTINNPPKVNFTVFSDGAVKADLKITNVSFAIAKLVPGANGEPDQWVNYIYRTETATAGVGPGTPGVPVLATAKQATTDGKQTDAALLAAQLVYNAAGYYTYTFKTDITDSTKTNGVVLEPALTHRVAIQLSYKNAKGEAVLVNPYFDFTIGADGKSVAVTDPAKTRKMTDVASCNGCHEKLALHGGGRVDTQYCVMCHNPGTTDANSGNNLNLSTMVHKIHAGKRLKAAGEDYTIWGYQNSKNSYAEVGFPQDLRNCTVCHSAKNPNTPQGDNWKTKISKEACLTCHTSSVGTPWEISHKVIAGIFVGAGAPAKDLPNQQCVRCHEAGVVSPERVHWNQNEENAAKYKMNIESATYDATARKVTVKYFLSDPSNGNKAYKLIANASDCTLNTNGTVKDCNNTKFGNLKLYLAYQNLARQSSAVTEYSAYNNGGNTAFACLFEGPTTTGTSVTSACSRTAVNDGSDHYTVDIQLPLDTATADAKGTARVVSIGQIKEPKLEVISAADPRLEVTPRVLVNTVAQHTFKDVVLSGALQPRRVIVSNEKCNVCHGALGTTSGSNTLANAFHGGARNTVEACVVCHDANRMSSTIMTNGSALNESYQFKRMIHGIHGNSKRFHPFTYGNKVPGAFCNPANTSDLAKAACDGSLTFAADVENYAAEVAWPGVGINCNACHVDNSYKTDKGTLGAVVKKDAGVTDPNLWKVISPKAATCTSCHDSSAAITHVIKFGGASFGDMTQADVAKTRESCDDCHASGGVKSVDTVHGQK